MKWVVFGVALAVGVPALWLMLRRGERWVRLALVAWFLLLAHDLNAGLGVNYQSMEWYRGDSRGFEITALDLMTLALLLFVLSRRPRDLPRRFLSFEGATLLLYALMALISTITAHVPIYAMFGLWKILRGVAVYFVFTQLIDREERASFLITCFALVPLVEAPVVFHQKYVQGIYRATGLLPHMNTLAMMMNLTVLPVLATFLTVGRKPPVWHLASIGAAVFNVLATGSRGGMVSLAIGVGVCALFLRPRHLSPRRLKLLGVAAVGATLVLAVALDTVIRRFETAPEQSKLTRLDLNACAAEMARDFTFGAGLNNYSHMIANTPYGEKAPLHAERGRDDGVAHHIYWLTAAELGWVGLGVFLVMIAAFLWVALRLAFGASDALYRAVGIGALAAMTALHLQGFLEWILRQTNVWFLFCAMAGALTAISRLDRARARALRLGGAR